MSLLLQHKILVGYFLLMAIIGSMAATLLHERNRVIGIESETHPPGAARCEYRPQVYHAPCHAWRNCHCLGEGRFRGLPFAPSAS